MSERSQVQLSTDPSDTGNTGIENQEVAKTNETQETTFGGYASVEELVAAHEALKADKKPDASNEGEEAGPKVPKEGESTSESGSEDDNAQKTITSVGLDWNGLNTEYQTNGKLSDETYAALAEKGIDRDAVDTYIAGKTAQAQAYDNAVYGSVGGQQEYEALVDWISNTCSATEKQAFTNAVRSGDAAHASAVVEGFAARRAKTRGTPPNLLNGNSNPTGVAPYKSQAEMVRDMRDKRYQTDPAFRKEVQDRLKDAKF